ncbi:MAG: Peptide deformylase [Anaerolineales bacterium]|nr:Peptide deformylase [Anaerolineales bacterium]
MAIRKIVTLDEGNPVLRQKARRIRRVTPAIQQLMDDMVETMRDAAGAGLAGPQVDVLLRVIVVEVPKDFEDPDAGTWLYALANPEIARQSGDVEEGQEGCLSIPNIYGLVERPPAVTVKGLDRSGRKVRIKAEGYLARVLQHEIDHLEGTLFIDHITEQGKLFRIEPEDVEEEPATAVAMG